MIQPSNGFWWFIRIIIIPTASQSQTSARWWIVWSQARTENNFKYNSTWQKHTNYHYEGYEIDQSHSRDPCNICSRGKQGIRADICRYPPIRTTSLVLTTSALLIQKIWIIFVHGVLSRHLLTMKPHKCVGCSYIAMTRHPRRTKLPKNIKTPISYTPRLLCLCIPIIINHASFNLQAKWHTYQSFLPHIKNIHRSLQ